MEFAASNEAVKSKKWRERPVNVKCQLLSDANISRWNRKNTFLNIFDAGKETRRLRFCLQLCLPALLHNIRAQSLTEMDGEEKEFKMEG